MSNWITVDFKQDDWSAITKKPGCYAIFLDQKIAYVGQSTNIHHRLFHGHGLRLSQHSIKIVTPWGRISDVVIKIAYSRRYGDWAMREVRLIRRLRPQYNFRGARSAIDG